jgi:diguanylate cyclase (GGDEF)-like protein
MDLVVRYGGEEFVILLPEIPAPTAAAVAERMRLDVASIQIPSAWGDLSVTISIGAAELQPGMPDLAALIAAAVRLQTFYLQW